MMNKELFLRQAKELLNEKAEDGSLELIPAQRQVRKRLFNYWIIPKAGGLRPDLPFYVYGQIIVKIKVNA